MKTQLNVILALLFTFSITLPISVRGKKAYNKFIIDQNLAPDQAADLADIFQYFEHQR